VTPPPAPPLGGEGSKAEKRCPAPPSLVGKGAGGLGSTSVIKDMTVFSLTYQITKNFFSDLANAKKPRHRKTRSRGNKSEKSKR
jgi:hypothetical protein